jgi:hypothetical protein
MAIAYQATRKLSADIAKADKSDFHDCTQSISDRRCPPIGKS